MSSIDEALKKAYERRNSGAVARQAGAAVPIRNEQPTVRELYVHPPESVRTPKMGVGRPAAGGDAQRPIPDVAIDSPSVLPLDLPSRSVPATSSDPDRPLPARTSSETGDPELADGAIDQYLGYEVLTVSPGLAAWETPLMKRERVPAETTVDAPVVVPAKLSGDSMGIANEAPVGAAEEPERHADSRKEGVADEGLTAACQTAVNGREVSQLPEKISADVPGECGPMTVPRQFRAAWEVDRFLMPETCYRAIGELSESLQVAAADLYDACAPAHPVVSVCSWLPREGRTTAAILLAHAVAKTGLRVLLVDGNGDHPVLAEQLGVDAQEGWRVGRTSDADLAECCVYSVADQFTILPLAEPERFAEPEGQQQWSHVLARLTQHFDVVLVDQRPGFVAFEPEARDLVGLWLLVRDLRRTSDESLDQFARQLERQVKAPVRIVENFAVDRQEMEHVA